jgi:hypothetical protein
MRAVDFNISLPHCSKDEYKKELILPAGSGISKSTGYNYLDTGTDNTWRGISFNESFGH